MATGRFSSLFGPRRLSVLLPAAAAGYLAVVFTESAIFTVHFVSGPSMSPTLSPDYNLTGKRDAILVPKWPWYGLKSVQERNFLKRGDVVAFWKPHDPESLSVKRVIGIPGDKINRDRRRVQNDRNSKKLGLARVADELTVPAGQIWVEGDNWRNSLDSNDFGTVPINLVTGKATAVVWPPSRFGRIEERQSKDSSKTRVTHGTRPNTTWEEFNYK
jgi:inner membrane protease subunit 2